MDKNQLQVGVNLLTKSGSVLTVSKRNNEIVFRFNDGSNQFVSLDEFDEDLHCNLDRWSVIKQLGANDIWNFEETMRRGVIYDKNKNKFNIFPFFEKFCDGYDTVYEKNVYYFQENGEAYDYKKEWEAADYEPVKKYYIIERGVKTYSNRNLVILIDSSGEKHSASWRYIIDNFFYE